MKNKRLPLLINDWLRKQYRTVDQDKKYQSRRQKDKDARLQKTGQYKEVLPKVDSSLNVARLRRILSEAKEAEGILPRDRSVNLIRDSSNFYTEAASRYEQKRKSVDYAPMLMKVGSV